VNNITRSIIGTHIYDVGEEEKEEKAVLESAINNDKDKRK
jgi:hypothetical protein